MSEYACVAVERPSGVGTRTSPPAESSALVVPQYRTDHYYEEWGRGEHPPPPGVECWTSSDRPGVPASSPLDSSDAVRWRGESRRGSLVPDDGRAGDMGEGVPKNKLGDTTDTSPSSLGPPCDSEEAESSLEPGWDA